MKATVDPVTLEVMRNAFQSVAEEMGAALIRTALSTNIKDRRDCSTAVYTPDGQLVAQAEHIPLHLGLMVSVVRKTLDRFPLTLMEPGDAIITNDPYISGSHLPDICMITPVFADGRCVALLANLAHHVDVGGMVPGSMPTVSTEIFQEGIRIPPVKLRSRGEVCEPVLSLIAANVRTREELYGDFRAQMAANNVGERRLLELVARHGTEPISGIMREIIDYAERCTRQRIRELPQGSYAFQDYLEGDGLSERRMRIHACVTVTEDGICVDFTGTAPQARGSVNSTRPVTLACVYFTLRSVIDPELPSSEGSCRPVKVITPPGTLVNPLFPAPVSNANINTSQRITDVLLGALAQALPQRVPAASTGSMSNFTVGGVDSRTGDYYSHVETYGGGQGALFDLDGMDGVHTHMTNTRNASVEVMEIACPLRVERYGLVPDSGGPGRRRGGAGILREITLLGDEAVMTLGTERREIPPWGLDGGGPGGTSDSTISTPEGETERLPAKVTRSVKAGTRIVIQTAGGGGHGNPAEREEDRVLQDVMEGLVSAEKARQQYGVVVDTEQGIVDREATRLLRESQFHRDTADGIASFRKPRTHKDGQATSF